MGHLVDENHDDDDDDGDYEQPDSASENDSDNNSDLVDLSNSFNKSTIDDEEVDEAILAAESRRDETAIAIAQYNFRVEINSEASQSLRRSARVTNMRLLKKASFK